MLQPTFVVAVSGGVDSMVLLDMMAKETSGRTRNGERGTANEERRTASEVAKTKKALNNKRPSTKALMIKERYAEANSSFAVRHSPFVLIVAHFDHGIRADSAEDCELVAKIAKKYNLVFEHEKGRLGQGASEAQARTARYLFLDRVKEKYQAQAIVTAHHQDDVIETAMINLLRGTGRRGVASLNSSAALIRPLLDWSKSQIIAYAKKHGLEWREDSTNSDEKYLRNYLRRRVVALMSPEQRASFLNYIEKLRQINQELDNQIANALSVLAEGHVLDRTGFIQLPHVISLEVLAAWLRQNNIIGYDRKTLERLVVALKTSSTHRNIEVMRGVKMAINKHDVALQQE